MENWVPSKSESKWGDSIEYVSIELHRVVCDLSGRFPTLNMMVTRSFIHLCLDLTIKFSSHQAGVRCYRCRRARQCGTPKEVLACVQGRGGEHCGVNGMIDSFTYYQPQPHHTPFLVSPYSLLVICIHIICVTCIDLNSKNAQHITLPSLFPQGKPEDQTGDRVKGET